MVATGGGNHGCVSGALKDQVSPYTISLIVVIEEYCRYDQARKQGDREALTEKQERQLMLTLLNLVQSADLQLKTLIQRINEIDGTDFVDTLTQRLCDLSEDGVGALIDLMLSVDKILFEGEDNSVVPCIQGPPLLEKTSVLGVFIRRIILAFNKLSFSQVTKVQSQYMVYINTWKAHTQEGNSLLDATGFGEVSSMNLIGQSMTDGQDDSCFEDLTSIQKTRLSETIHRHSQRQAEYFIAQQTNLLAHNETEALSPKQLQQKISQVLRSNPQLAEAHFVSYMNNLRVAEYCGAMESHHHYFDRQHAAAATGQAQGGKGGKQAPEDEGLSRWFRYAALSLASLQYRFGHRREALAAIQEAVRMAQEFNDSVCLQHALSWLQRLGIQQSGATAYLLDRLVSKSTELNLPYVTSLGVQAFANHNALSVAKPASVFEFILKSDIVNCQHSLADLMCTSYAQKAALWHMYGNKEMCLLQCELMLNLNTSELGVYHNAEAECLALCHLATIHAQQGEYDLSSEILNTTKSRFLPHSQYAPLWMQCEQQLTFRRSCHRGDWTAAEQALAKLNNVNSLEAKYCECVLQKEKGETTLALKSLQALQKECASKETRGLDKPQLYCRLLLVESELLCSSGNESRAAEPLLECITLCVRHHYAHHAAMATLHLAFVQYSLGVPCQALVLLESVLLRVLAHGSTHDRARARYLWVRCTVGAAARGAAEHRHKVLSSCVQSLTDVCNLFREVQAGSRVKHVLYYQARLYNELGYIAERNKCALEFNRLDKLYPTRHTTTICLF